MVTPSPAGGAPLGAESTGPSLMVAWPDPELLPKLPVFAGFWALLSSPAALAALLAEPSAAEWRPAGRRLLVAPVDAALVAASIPFRTRGANGPFPEPALVSTLVGTGFLRSPEPIPLLLARETRLADGWRLLAPDATDLRELSFDAPSTSAAPPDSVIERTLRSRHGEPFVGAPGGLTEARRFVAPASLRVVLVFPDDVAPLGSAPLGRGVSALLIEGDDLPTFWSDALLRAETPDRALALVERLDPRQPVPIEVLPRVQRWWLPASGHVVELRGRGTLQSTRLAPPDEGRRALVAMVAMASRSELELAFAGLTPVGALEMALNGALWLERDPRVALGGEPRWRLASPEAVGAALAQLPDLTSVSRVDALLLQLRITAVERDEAAGPGGRPRVIWRLRECGAVLRWDDGLQSGAGEL